MYLTSPLVGVAVAVGVPVAVLIAVRPMVGVWVGLLAVTAEVLSIRVPPTTVTLAETIFIFTAVVGLGHLVLRQNLAPGHPQLAFSALIVAGLFGLFLEPSSASEVRVIRVWCIYLIISLVVSQASRNEIERMLICLIAAAGTLGLVAMFTPSELQLYQGGNVVSGRAETGFEHPNVFSHFLLLALAPSLVFARLYSGWRRGIATVAAVGIIGGLLLSLSRGAIMGAAASVLLLLAWPAFRRTGLAALLVVVIAATLSLQPLLESSLVSSVATRYRTIGDSSSVPNDPRIAIWRAAPAMIADRPLLGVGEANYPLIAPAYGLRDVDGSGYDHPHNIFLTFAIEIGLLGLAGFVVFLLATTRSALSALAGGVAREPVVLAVAASLVGLLVTSLLEYPIRTNVVLATVMMFVGAIVAFERLANDSTPHTASSRLAELRGTGIPIRTDPS